MVGVQAEIGGSFLTLGIFRREGRDTTEEAGTIGEVAWIAGSMNIQRQGLRAEVEENAEVILPSHISYMVLNNISFGT